VPTRCLEKRTRSNRIVRYRTIVRGRRIEGNCDPVVERTVTVQDRRDQTFSIDRVSDRAAQARIRDERSDVLKIEIRRPKVRLDADVE